MNSIRFMRADTCGMYLFNIRPEKKAPKMPSSPMNVVRAALRNMTDSTKINCMTASL